MYGPFLIALSISRSNLYFSIHYFPPQNRSLHSILSHLLLGNTQDVFAQNNSVAQLAHSERAFALFLGSRISSAQCISPERIGNGQSLIWQPRRTLGGWRTA